MKKFRIQMVIALIVLICGVSLMGLVYIMFNKTEVYVNPGIVTRAPSPVAAPVLPTNWSYPPKGKNISYSPQTNYQKSAHHMPSVPMQSVGGLYMTSSAQVHSVGGGGNAGGYYGTSNSGGMYSVSYGSSRGISYSHVSSVVMPATSFVALASTRSMAVPESREAPELAVTPRRVPGTPDDDTEEQEDQQPIGDGLLTLMLLIAAYCGFIALRRKRTEIKN